MYSPRISDDLIPVLYRIRRREGIPMTRVVDRFLRDSVNRYLFGLSGYEPGALYLGGPFHATEAYSLLSAKHGYPEFMHGSAINRAGIELAGGFYSARRKSQNGILSDAFACG